MSFSYKGNSTVFYFGIWNICRFDKIETLIQQGKITWADEYKISSLSELVFFTQYERDIDKFKPSRSGFVTGLYRNIWEHSNSEGSELEVSWNSWELEKVLNFMHKHPIKSYVYVEHTINHICEERSGFSCFKEYIADYLYYHKNRIIKNREYRKLKRSCIRLMKQLSTFDSMLIDKGECYTPRLTLCLRGKPNFNIEKHLEEQEIIDLYDSNIGNKVSFELWNVDFFDEHISNETIEEDKKLRKFFNDKYDYMVNGDTGDWKLIYSNIQ